jgi:hypothetical protein
VDPCDGSRHAEAAAEHLHALISATMRGTGSVGALRQRARPEAAAEHLHALISATMRGTGSVGALRQRAQPEAVVAPPGMAVQVDSIKTRVESAYGFSA